MKSFKQELADDEMQRLKNNQFAEVKKDGRIGRIISVDNDEYDLQFGNEWSGIETFSKNEIKLI